MKELKRFTRWTTWLALAMVVATPALAQVGTGDPARPGADAGEHVAGALPSKVGWSGSPEAVLHRYDNVLGVPLAIPDNGCGATPPYAFAESTITVPDTFTVGYLTVGVVISHASRGDLRLQLVGPDGTVVELAWNQGGAGVNINVLWDDYAPGAIDTANEGIPPSTSAYAFTFKPFQALAGYRGKTSVGDWRLQVCDSAATVVGALVQWSLIFKSGIDISPATLDAGTCPGGWLHYYFDVVNNTGAATAVSLAYGSVWTVLGPASTAVLADGDAQYVDVQVKVPNAAPVSSAATCLVTGTAGPHTATASATTHAWPYGSWSDHADSPAGRGTRDHALVHWNGKLYKIGGQNPSATNFVDIYDIATDTWSQGTALPTAKSWIDCAAIDLKPGGVNTPKIYCAGGYTTTAQSAMDIYDINTNTWTTGAALPAARYAYMGVAYNNRYYIIGGYTTAIESSVLIYNPATNSYDSSLPAMSIGHRNGAAWLVGSTLYVAGGLSAGSTSTNVMDVLNLASSTWSLGTPMPNPWLRCAYGVADNRYLILVGSYMSDMTASNYSWIYDTAVAQWYGGPTFSHQVYGNKGASDGTHFWTVSGRKYLGGFIYGVDTSRLEVCAAPQPVVGYVSHTASDSCASGGPGSGDGVLDPGEVAAIVPTLSNSGSDVAYGTTAVLSSTTPGVAVTASTSSFGDIPDNSVATAATPYVVELGTSMPCGTSISFQLDITAGAYNWTSSFSRFVGPVPTTALAEGFNTATPPALPSGWVAIVVSPGANPPTWTTATASGHPAGVSPFSAPNMADFNSYTASAGASVRLYRSLAFDLSGYNAVNLAIEVYHDSEYVTSNDTVRAQVSLDGGTTWLNEGAPISRYDGSVGWKQHTVNLPDAANASSVLVGVLGTSAYGNDILVDDLVLTASSCHQCCPVVTFVPVPGALPDAVQTVAYSQTIAALGGLAPYTYAVTAGPLPPGLSLNTATGLLSGTPTTRGSYPFTIGTTDQAGCHGSATYQLAVVSVFSPAGDRVDLDDLAGRSSNLNGVFEAGETVVMSPMWTNLSAGTLALAGVASVLTGPAGATYTLADTSADYGSVAPGATVTAAIATGNAYRVQVDNPSTRPAQHWDATVQETLPDASTRTWTLHIGGSFVDVPTSYLLYAFVENIYHNGVTQGCTTTGYCPANQVSRAQMAMFIARALAGGDANVPATGTVGATPYNCSSIGSSVFSDVAPTAQYCRHVHYIAARSVTQGCTTSTYCPTNMVTRGAMSMFVARAMVGSDAAVPLSYTDPTTLLAYSCNPLSPSLHFADMTASTQYCRHAHYLWATATVAGCTGSAFCGTNMVTRGQMSKFLANGFSLHLY